MQVPTNKNLLDIFQLKVSNRYASTHNVMFATYSYFQVQQFRLNYKF